MSNLTPAQRLGHQVPVNDAGRSDLTELAALLNEIRQAWRPLDWPGRDRLRGLVLQGVCQFLGEQSSDQPPEACPWDVSGLVDAPRERLLLLLRGALFDEAQLRDRLARTRAGADAQQRDLKVTVARCANLLDHRRKTVPMVALKAALYPEMTL